MPAFIIRSTDLPHFAQTIVANKQAQADPRSTGSSSFRQVSQG